MRSTILTHSPAPARSAGPVKCRRKFLRFFPDGFRDDTYLAWERSYKWAAHERWMEELDRGTMQRLLRDGQEAEISARAVRIESRTNLLFSFEKMALRDAVKSKGGARLFARGLYAFLHSDADLSRRFANWCEILGDLPRRQTRVLTWPVATIFGFLAQPGTQMFVKPNVLKRAVAAYGAEWNYLSAPNWETYAQLLRVAGAVRRDLSDLRPRDMIDIQGFLWVQGSDEYE